jgi:arylamine N-acetyltransferase
MKIKDEYKGKTIVKNTSLGNMTIVVDNIDIKRYQYYVSIGFGYLFENQTTTAPIRYEGIETDEQTEAPAVTPKRKRRTNAKG